MKETSQLTPKVLAFSEVPGYDINEAIWWALDMLALNYETPSLLILASLSLSDNYFEKVEYLRKACSELGYALKTGEAGIISYSSFFIEQIAHKNQIKDNLSELYTFCQAKDYTESIYDFWLLYWAWDDFNYNDNCSAYWDEATPQNIEEIIIEVANKWLVSHKASLESN